MKNKNVIASVITYNPNLSDLCKNFKSISSNVDVVLIIDNNSSNIDKIEKLCY